MSLALAPPPFRFSRHTPPYTLSIDSILASSFNTAPSSSASTQDSFHTAFSSPVADSPFQYYLPHISTPSTPFFSFDEKFSCNVSVHTEEQSSPVSEFHHYVPEESTERNDVYTTPSDDAFLATVHAWAVAEVAEQKALLALKDFVFCEPPTPGVEPPCEVVAQTGLPEAEGMGGDGVDVSSYTAGEQIHPSGTEKTGKPRLTKAQPKWSRTVTKMSEKVKAMFGKLQIGKKPDE